MSRHEPTKDWFKSSYSASNSSCVEVRFGEAAVHVRDSKQRAADPQLDFGGAQWDAFLSTVRS